MLGCSLHSQVLEGQGEPWHRPKVSIVLILLFVAGEKDHFKDLVALIVLLIKLDEQRCELLARLAIVHAEVEHEKLGLRGLQSFTDRGCDTTWSRAAIFKDLIGRCSY